ncbi:MAG: glycoside hydrolase family 88 protein [Bryobacteraceae bacterium]
MRFHKLLRRELLSLPFAMTASAASGPAVIRSAAGVTAGGVTIDTLLTPGDGDYNASKQRVLLIGGVDGDRASSRAVEAAFEWFQSGRASAYRKRFVISAVPLASPEGKSEASFPPTGEYYGGCPDMAAGYLWRWTGMHAPDLVVQVSAGDAGRSDSLVRQLPRVAACNTGTIPARLVPVATGFLPRLLAELSKTGPLPPSPARVEIQRRIARKPDEVARQLSKKYGHDLKEAVYIPALALIARLKMGHREDVERIVAPYVSGQKDSLEKASGSHLSGHLIFGELARSTGNPRYLQLAKAAADLGFDAQGRPLESMPMHMEMSDSVFMGCPILAQVGRLTGDAKYFDMCLRHMRFMLKLNLRRDGLHRHSPLDETAWGRGNGFPALGLSLSLSELPTEYPGRAEMLTAFRAHMAALLPHQDQVTGAWHQVVDHKGSYRELTATCAISFAMLRGVRAGWLERARYQPVIDRAWYAVKSRVAANGELVDVCTGTGKQKSLREYLNRTALLGEDPRGGGMSIMLAAEMARPA